jgi:lipopolysaccharide biosynthesis glycosyltransferase
VSDLCVVTLSTNEDDQVKSVVMRAAERFEVLNGIRPRIIREADMLEIGDPALASPKFAKCYLWDLMPDSVDRILYYDRDIVPMRALGELPDADFAAAPDIDQVLERGKTLWPLFQQTRFYFNSGLMLARRNTRPVFDMVKSMQCSRRDAANFHDETLFNLVAHHMHGVYRLPRAWNYIALSESHIVPAPKMVHCCGCMRPFTLMEVLLNLPCSV